LLDFSEPITRIAVGRRSCLALGESGSLYVMDVDFTTSSLLRLTSPDVVPDLPTKEHSVLHMAGGWVFSAAVIKGIGIMVWKSDVTPEERNKFVERQTTQPHMRERNARLVSRPEETQLDSVMVHDPSVLDIIGLMVGDGYLVYLTERGTVHRANFDDSMFEPEAQGPTSFLFKKFVATPKLSYLSGSFLHFGLFNTAGDVFIGNATTQEDTDPYIYEGLQRRGVIAIACGDWHALALCEDGSILSWGKELQRNGCLGMGYKFDADATEMGLIVAGQHISCPEPRKVPGFGGQEDRFAFCVAAAGWHSAALVADFKV